VPSWQVTGPLLELAPAAGALLAGAAALVPAALVLAVVVVEAVADVLALVADLSMPP
jgi:hypothetical protein